MAIEVLVSKSSQKKRELRVALTKRLFFRPASVCASVDVFNDQLIVILAAQGKR